MTRLAREQRTLGEGRLSATAAASKKLASTPEQYPPL
jgi:hypothetical protein